MNKESPFCSAVIAKETTDKYLKEFIYPDIKNNIGLAISRATISGKYSCKLEGEFETLLWWVFKQDPRWIEIKTELEDLGYLVFNDKNGSCVDICWGHK